MRPHRDRDAGSAVVEFVVVVPMLALLVLGVMQVGLALYVRSTIASAAAEGARVAAVSGGDVVAGEARTRAALAGSLADGVVDDVSVTRGAAGGVATLDVVVRARLPLVGLLGPSALEVHGHAIAEA